MNYRHAFHAGNFADLVKHGALTVCLDLMTRDPAPLTVIDTHAGAGAYDLSNDMAVKSGEAQAGIVRLMADPAPPEAFDILVAAVSRINEGGPVRLYPGSPLLMLAALRADDPRLVACELRPDDHGALENLMAGRPADILKADGFAVAVSRTPQAGQVLVHIDPPYERGDDYRQAVAASVAVLARNRAATVMIWLPLKDLETFDRFLRDIEDRIDAPVLIAETRLKPLDEPMRMNGCALAVINPPAGLDLALAQICRWTVQNLGQDGGDARVWEL